MRTSELCDFEKALSEMNNNLSQIVFVFEQFFISNKDNISKHPEMLTTKKYSENKYASQFNVKLKDLNNQASLSLDYVFDSLFVFAYAQFEIYLKDVYLFVKDNINHDLSELPESRLYEVVLERLGIDTKNDIDNLFVSTFHYFKLRRNAIMHRDKSRRFQGALEYLIKGSFSKDPDKRKLFSDNQLNGKQLNAEWKKYVANLKSLGQKGYAVKTIDFAAKDISKVLLSDLFDVFNFYRLYAETIDEIIINKADRSKLLNFCKTKYDEFYPNVAGEDFESFSKKFGRISKIALNLTVEKHEAEKIYSGV
ncbi:hypothetical protein Q5H92_11510 [Hymenobacter sp. M29]|uniref:Cthe-2314-like HEPN domain-containing protein n=1 Tax=Hymenobacter mellowenesis TaxID=3063995 RepID=A0ABT9AAW6_9BACT|nr:hypothetical protein [Hymenobacter sp. M29]MDO7846988.1 hypothetical protein [Hymenobacter sp. M29]